MSDLFKAIQACIELRPDYGVSIENGVDNCMVRKCNRYSY